MEKSVRVSALLFGCFLTAGCCLHAQEATNSEQVIAEVGGQKLTLGDLQQQQASSGPVSVLHEPAKGSRAVDRRQTHRD
jgi:hypothetical protein